MSGDGEPVEETPHITVVRKQWRLRQQAAQKPHFKIVDGEIVPYTVSPPADDLATTVADAVAAKIANPEIGQMVEGHGIFFGTWEPKARDGNSLGKIFNVFAAPEDLTDASDHEKINRYLDAVKRIVSLKNWHGHDGTHYATDKELYKALKEGNYNGGWFIPTRELLTGTEADGPDGIREGTIVQPDNLFDHQNKGALKDTFNMAGYPHGYWSSTEYRADDTKTGSVRFSDGCEYWDFKNCLRLSCRPVRLELRS